VGQGDQGCRHQVRIINAKAIDHPLRYIKRDEYARVLREMDARLREIWKSTRWN
jgi:hypothetical protein